MGQSYLDLLPPELTMMIGSYLSDNDKKNVPFDIVLNQKEYLLQISYPEIWKIAKDFIKVYHVYISSWYAILTDFQAWYKLCGNITVDCFKYNNYDRLNLAEDTKRLLKFYFMKDTGVSTDLMNDVIWRKFENYNVERKTVPGDSFRHEYVVEDFLDVYSKYENKRLGIMDELIRVYSYEDLVKLQKIFKFVPLIDGGIMLRLLDADIRTFELILTTGIIENSGGDSVLTQILGAGFKFGQSLPVDIQILKMINASDAYRWKFVNMFPLSVDTYVHPLLVGYANKPIDSLALILTLLDISDMGHLSEATANLRKGVQLNIYQWIQNSNYRYRYGQNAINDLAIINRLNRTMSFYVFRDVMIADGFKLLEIYLELINKHIDEAPPNFRYQIFRIILGDENLDLLEWTQSNDFRFDYNSFENRTIALDLRPFIQHLDFDTLLFLKKDGYPFSEEEKLDLFGEEEIEKEYDYTLDNDEDIEYYYED